MTSKRTKSNGGPSDRDLLVGWAAEEFIAAGRVDCSETRSVHRRRAHFFTEVLQELRASPSAPSPTNEVDQAIGRVLAQAFRDQEPSQQ